MNLMPRRSTYRHAHGIKPGSICDWPQGGPSPEEVASRATYTGNAQHKTYASPAGPPALRADKSKCDKYESENWPRLVNALRRAIRAECVSEFRGDFPFRAWVWINGVLHEARLTNEANGEYHGFPINDRQQYPEPLERVEKAPRVEIPVVRD
jgi:hypothetical protein